MMKKRDDRLPSRSFNCTFTTIKKGLSNHGHYRNNHGFLFDLRPKLQVFRLEDVELATSTSSCATRQRPLTSPIASSHITARAYAPEMTK